MFHTYTGCDTVSHFVQVGKKTAWKVWETLNEFTVTFYELHNAPGQIAEETEAFLEYFTILLYDMTATGSSINEIRKNLFIHKECQMSGLPPTKAGLQQHEKGSIARCTLLGLHHSAILAVALSCWVGMDLSGTVEASLVKLARSQCNLSRATEVFWSEQMKILQMCSCTSKMHSLLHKQSWLWQCIRLW